MSPTRVLVDGYELTASRHRGIGTYLRYLIQGLNARDDVAVTVTEAGRVEARWAAEQRHEFRLRRDLRHAARAGTAVAHSPAKAPPARSQLPWVQTLHDLTPLRWTGPGLERERRHWQRVGPRLRDAARVIAVSRATADDAMRLLDVSAHRIEVVPHGVDAAFGPDDGSARAVAPPHLLWVSSWGPHKGFADAVAVIDALADGGEPHVLHVAGGNDAWMRGQLDAVIARARHPDRVQVLGHVPDLAAAYRAASAVLVTSRSEGFCFPAAEAMACGTPVVAYDNTAITELVGGAGSLAPDGDVAALAAAVSRVLHDDAWSGECVARGLDRVRPLTWEASIAAHVEIYRAATG